jgi:hypothetical protein
MRIGAIVRCYRLTDYLEPILMNLSWVDRLIVANFRFKDVAAVPDKTEGICRRLNLPNCDFIKGDGFSQKDIFNMCLEVMNCDYTLINDADEYLNRKYHEFAVQEMVEKRKDAAFCNVLDYARKDKVYPMRTHKPVIAVKKGIKFIGNRAPNYGDGINLDINLHHFGYMMMDMEWKNKNIWYPRHDFEAITSQEPINYDTPSEVLEILNGK